MSNSSESLQGKLILDSGKLAGSYFERSVILICRHNESGTFGLILNRPVKKNIGSLVDQSIVGKLVDIPLYVGGPVQTGALSFLEETTSNPDYDILPSLQLNHSLEELKNRLSSEETMMRLHAYAGYAGWASNQLEQEMKTGCWLIHPASISSVFHSHPELLWRQVLRQKGGLYSLMAECPDNPRLN